MKKLTAGFLVTSFIASNIALAGGVGSEYERQIKKQLLKIESMVIDKGFSNSTHNDKFDKLKPGEEKEYNVRLESGKHYAIIGVCDNDCRDLDLSVYANGRKISDTSNDDHPVVEFTPSSTGTYQLTAKMYNCKTDYCVIGIAVFSKEA